MSEPRHVLVTGGAGYIGSVLSELLLERGYRVTVLDRFFFGDTLAHLADDPKLRQIRGDVRTFDWDALDLGQVDAVFDLAALSNDPAGELNPEKTLEINHQGRARVARLASERGVERYVLASSCSVYGFQDGILDETSTTNPLTTYAEANLLAEASALPFAGGAMGVTVLRQATVYGLSPRMRFDLAINGMTLGLVQNGKIPVLRDGSQWRPMVHVRDTSRAFIAAMEAEREAVDGQIFNVGSNQQNLQILPLAERVAAAAGVPFQYEWYGEPDHRSYQVCFDKIGQAIGYRTEWTPETGAREIAEALREGRVEPTPRTRTVQWYKSLMEWQQILQNTELDGVLL